MKDKERRINKKWKRKENKKHPYRRKKWLKKSDQEKKENNK